MAAEHAETPDSDRGMTEFQNAAGSLLEFVGGMIMLLGGVLCAVSLLFVVSTGPALGALTVGLVFAWGGYLMIYLRRRQVQYFNA